MKMLKPSIRLLFIGVLFNAFLSSCVSREDIVYFQGMEEAQKKIENNSNQSLGIKPNDLLTIMVTASEEEAAMPFNLPVVGLPQAGGGLEMGTSANVRQQFQTYLVGSDGSISFPVLGKVDVEGLNRQELAQQLTDKINKYIQDPIVNVRIVNFQVSVLGEVNNPGTFNVNDEYLSLPKALGLAGDMSIYGERSNVLVVREENGAKTHAYLDLTDANVINSPYYYLQQNDVVYVEPNGPQRQSASYNRNASVYISIASVIVSVAVLLTRM